jgi:hypothetical protein
MTRQAANQTDDKERHRWAGPALFIAVFILFAVFFWWFVRA